MYIDERYIKLLTDYFTKNQYFYITKTISVGDEPVGPPESDKPDGAPEKDDNSQPQAPGDTELPPMDIDPGEWPAPNDSPGGPGPAPRGNPRHYGGSQRSNPGAGMGRNQNPRNNNRSY